jgi:class 3 adenylate cyclase
MAHVDANSDAGGRVIEVIRKLLSFRATKISMTVQRIVILAVMLLLQPVMGLAQSSSDEHLKQMQESSGGMEHPKNAPPFYREQTFLVLTGLGIAGGGFLALRFVRRRWLSGPVEFVSEALLVVDIVSSTRLATHYGNGSAMRANNLLKERTLAAAEPHGVGFVKNTGDGYFMTFSSAAGAVGAASALLNDLRDRPPDPSSGPPLKLRVAISYGEILIDSSGSRHGATINKAFRLEGVARENFSQVERGIKLEEIPEFNRIFVDEEAAQELRHHEVPLRFMGFCHLKGFSGLHRVFEVLWDRDGEAEKLMR